MDSITKLDLAKYRLNRAKEEIYHESMLKSLYNYSSEGI